MQRLPTPLRNMIEKAYTDWRRGNCQEHTCGCLITYIEMHLVPELNRLMWFAMTAGAVITGLLIILIILLFVPACHAQSVPAGRVEGGSRLLIDAQAGSASGLGYRLPDLVFGVTAEIPIKTRWEVQGAAKWSPDRKYITGDGNEAVIGARGVLWVNSWLAASGQVRYSRLWTSQFDKAAWVPSAGVVLRDRWYGLPGRAYFDYVFPTGCQWATVANPCTIQSNRESGIEGFQEFRIYSHWRMGIRAAWVRFAEQSNQNDRAAGRIWRNTGTVDVVLRYEFRAASLEAAY